MRAGESSRGPDLDLGDLMGTSQRPWRALESHLKTAENPIPSNSVVLPRGDTRGREDARWFVTGGPEGITLFVHYRQLTA